ncbi:hypothetical protein KKC44_01090 [Patescibacteria group bacterium]|nr:hypothetical protein [Patescibacteria group bacterium]MBU2259178.1 hypothetical protein [Patescibacteria group bacterium]
MTTPTPPAVPSVEELYDSLMEKIEPELVSSQVPLLEEKYKDETPKQKKGRAERYKRAYVQFMETFEAYMKDLNQKAEEFKRHAFATAEEKTHEAETKQLADLENTISSL